MKWIYFILAFVLVTLSVSHTHGQEKAVTEEGDTVVLKNDGTWLYLEDYNPTAQYTTPKNIEKVMEKPSNTNKTTSATPKDYIVSYDNRVWEKTNPDELNPEAELGFQFKNGDAYGVVIYEKIEIELENIQNIALENAKSVAQNIHLTLKEYREVNNDTLLCTKMEGTMRGMDILYYTYYHSDRDGTLQFHAFTSQKLFSEYKGKIEDLLNGLEIKE